MGYRIYAISPKQWQDYGYEWMNETMDEWYMDDFHYAHNIWPSWIEGYFVNAANERTYFPDDLKEFYSDITDAEDAKRVATKLESVSKDDINIKSFIEWLRFWAGKNAKFFLSS